MLKIVFGFTINNSNNDKNSANIANNEGDATIKIKLLPQTTFSVYYSITEILSFLRNALIHSHSSFSQTAT